MCSLDLIYDIKMIRTVSVSVLTPAALQLQRNFTERFRSANAYISAAYSYRYQFGMNKITNTMKVDSSSFSTSTSKCVKARDSKYVGSVKQSEGLDAERASSEVQMKLHGLFSSGMNCPTLATHKMVIDGMRYDELPIVHIKATRNNTHIALSNFKGDVLTLSTCGCEGFKNAKKGTNIAAQASAMTVGQRAKNFGTKYVRVAVKGMGPGRLAAIKGLQLTGLEVVSISDTTKVLFGGERPRKKRRL